MGITTIAQVCISVTIRVGNFKKLALKVREKYIEDMCHVHDNEIVYSHEKLDNDNSELSYPIAILLDLSRFGYDRTDTSCISEHIEDALHCIKSCTKEAEEFNKNVFQGMGYVSFSQILLAG
jgi:hypothetical protein